MPAVTVDNSDQSLSQIGEWFKEYFGCAGNKVDITAVKLQSSIKDIYDFMYDVSKIEKSINDSIKNIEGLRDRALRQAGVEIQQPAQEAATEPFSYLGHTPALLLEKLERNQTPQPATNNPTGQTNYTGNTASQITNVNRTTQQDANGREKKGQLLLKFFKLNLLLLNIFVMIS